MAHLFLIAAPCPSVASIPAHTVTTPRAWLDDQIQSSYTMRWSPSSCPPSPAVLILGNMRVSVGAVSRLFYLNPMAQTYSEPLRPWDEAGCFQHEQSGLALGAAAAALMQCNLRSPVRMSCDNESTATARPLEWLTPLRLRQRAAAQLDEIAGTLSSCRAVVRTCGCVLVVRSERLLGHLRDVVASMRKGLLHARRKLAIVHVVQDPRALLAASRRAGGRAPVSSHPRAVERWASRLCTAALADMATGVKLGAHTGGGDNGTHASPLAYVQIRYEHFVREPLPEALRVYRAIGQDMPHAVRNYTARLAEAVANETLAAKLVDAVGEDEHPRLFLDAGSADRWKRELTAADVHAIEQAEGCAAYMRHLHYVKPSHERNAVGTHADRPTNLRAPD